MVYQAVTAPSGGFENFGKPGPGGNFILWTLNHLAKASPIIYFVPVL